MNAARASVAGAVGFGLALALAGCDSMFVPPARTGTGDLRVSLSLTLNVGGDAQAFDRADAARIRLQRRNGGAVVVDRAVPLEANAVGREVSVEVEITEDPEVFDLTVQLSAGTQQLFAGTAEVTVRRGLATAVELPLQPVVASVVFPSSSVTLSAINQTLTLRAYALYVTGDTAHSVAVQWASQNQGIVTVSTAGVLTARAEGQTQVIATAGGAAAAVEVRVQAAVAGVTVTPARDTLTVGEEVQLAAVARDANGTSLTRTPSWQSSDPGVAPVDASGRVRAVSAGTATITATVEGRVGSSVIVVLLPPVRTVTVLPAAATVQVGGSLQLGAELRTADGLLVTRPVQWSSSNAAVASVSGSGLVLGVAPGIVTITASSEGVSGTAQVTVVSSVLSVSPASLSFTAVVGGSNPASQALTIANAGGGTLDWSVADNAAWLSVSPASGTNAGTVTASVNITGLVAGVYNATITVTGNASNSPRTVPVTLTITAAPLIGVSPTSLSFTGAQGGANPPPQSLSISNAGTGTLSWSVSDNAGWLSLNPASGTNTGTVTVSVSTAGLAAGVYNASVTVTGNASNSPRTVPVTLTVTAGAIINVSPTALSFTAVQGGANPASQTVSISNAGTGTLYPSYSGTSTSWLSLQGTSLLTLPPRLVSVTASVSTAGLAAGTYSAAITITGNASNSPVIVPVTLTVAPAVTTGQIGGRVTSVAGAPIAGATVTVVGTSRSAITSADGYYLITSLPQGWYAVTASALGYLSTTTSEQYVAAGQTTTFNLTLGSLPPPPTPPGGLVAVPAGSTLIDLSWTDYSTNESGFRIERCTGAGCTTFAEIATVGANTTSFRNSGLAPGTTYRYRVRAYNLGGNSGYTNTASATTTAGVAPVLSAGSSSVWAINDTGCSLYGPTRLGTSFRVVFSFSDADGDVPLSSSAVGGSWVFFPSGASGGVSGTYRYQPSVTGSGSSGTVTTYQCYVFGSDSYVDVTMTMTDASGRTGTLAPIRITKPAGAN